MISLFNLRGLVTQYGGLISLSVMGLFSLYLVTLLYGVGELLLAGTLLVLVAFAAWTYSSSKTMALRYLFPGVAAAIVFVVFPMVYTIAIGFTNFSSSNLLEYDRARQYLLDETYSEPGVSTYSFGLYQDGHQYRLRLEDVDDEKKIYISPPLALAKVSSIDVKVTTDPQFDSVLMEPLGVKDVIVKQKALKAINVILPSGDVLRLSSLREFAPVKPLYRLNPDQTLTNQRDNERLIPNFDTGYFENSKGEKVQPGFKVGIGFSHYARIFTDAKFSEPFLRIFAWTIAFSGLTVLFAASVGLLLAVVLNWDSLRGKGVYQILLFLPYAVPGFISILIFKGLFNQNLGEINMILNGFFGVKPAWFSDPFLAKVMLLLVNTWLGFPYMMIVCMGLIKSIPSDLYEASAVAGAGPLTNFFGITLPLILKPLTPLLISSFAFNFNNFVLITLLTGGRPDYLDISVPAGTTDILVSYTFRIAFQDSGQQFGLASAISTVIFFIVAAITLLQMRFTKIASDDKR